MTSPVGVINPLAVPLLLFHTDCVGYCLRWGDVCDWPIGVGALIDGMFLLMGALVAK